MDLDVFIEFLASKNSYVSQLFSDLFKDKFDNLINFFMENGFDILKHPDNQSDINLLRSAITLNFPINKITASINKQDFILLYQMLVDILMNKSDLIARMCHRLDLNGTPSEKELKKFFKYLKTTAVADVFYEIFKVILIP